MCLFIGDIGDNDKERDFISIYRIKEPQLELSEQEIRSVPDENNHPFMLCL